MQLITGGIILLIYVAIAIGEIPKLRMNRATIALVGAVILVIIGAISEEQAIHAIDLGTLLLLGAMMVLNVNLRLAGFFRYIGSRALRLANTPHALLAMVIFPAGVLSAIFLNDPICLMFTPIVVDITIRLGRNPIPYLIGLGTAANVGSVATITGNPQNVVIGQMSQIPYITFLAYLAPVALIGLCVCWVIVVLLYPKEFRTPLVKVELPPPFTYNPLLIRVVPIVIGLMIAFLIGLPIVTSACVAAGLLLISRLRPERLLSLDWDLLAFFAGLFVITGAIETTGISTLLFEQVSGFLQSGVAALSLATGALSNIISNVPAVLLLKTEINNFANPQQAWLTLAMSSTLAGNLTLLGSAATLIVAEVARVRGVRLGFMEYLRAGIPITIITLAIGIVWLEVVT
jgi:Na+/H+ antiporter NhaD/arsenite permease-like protein